VVAHRNDATGDGHDGNAPRYDGRWAGRASGWTGGEGARRGERRRGAILVMVAVVVVAAADTTEGVSGGDFGEVLCCAFFTNG